MNTNPLLDTAKNKAKTWASQQNLELKKEFSSCNNNHFKILALLCENGNDDKAKQIINELIEALKETPDLNDLYLSKDDEHRGEDDLLMIACRYAAQKGGDMLRFFNYLLDTEDSLYFPDINRENGGKETALSIAYTEYYNAIKSQDHKKRARCRDIIEKLIKKLAKVSTAYIFDTYNNKFDKCYPKDEEEMNQSFLEREFCKALKDPTRNDMVEIFLKTPAPLRGDINKSVPFTNPRTMLGMACVYNNQSLVKLLLELGDADVNIIDRQTGKTPLIYACESDPTKIGTFKIDKHTTILNRTTIVKLLIEKGANVNFKSNDGWTPLMYARANGHTEIVKLLLDKVAQEKSKSKPR